METSLLYIKTHSTFYTKSLPKKQYSYICSVCPYVSQYIQDMIVHLRNNVHLHYYENILHTYNRMYHDMFVTHSSRQTTVFTHQKEPSLDGTNTSINVVCSKQLVSDHLELATSIEEEKSSTKFFISPDITAELKALMKPKEMGNYMSLQHLRAIQDDHISALDYYNQLYPKKFLEFETAMFTHNKKMQKMIKMNIRLNVPRSDDCIHCLVCDVTHQYNASAFFDQHIRSSKHDTCLERLITLDEEMLELFVLLL